MPEIDIALGRIKKTLDRLSEEVTKGLYPPVMLKDFKSSVDQLRLTLWAVIEVEDQSKKATSGSATGMSQKVAEFRIKRLMRMLEDFRTDVTSGVIGTVSDDISSLAVSLRATSDTLARMRPN